MGASDPVVEGTDEKVQDGTDLAKQDDEEEEEDDDECCEGEKEEKGIIIQTGESQQSQSETKFSMLQTVNQIAPLEVVVPQTPNQISQTVSPRESQSTNTPLVNSTPQISLASLNSRVYTDRITLFLFALHLVVAIAAVCFFGFKAVQGVLSNDNEEKKHREILVLKYWFPQAGGATIASIIMALFWQKAIRTWPGGMVRVVLWSSFGISFSAAVLLLCFSMPTTVGVGVALLIFSICESLYACWVTPRLGFGAKVLAKSLEPISKFPDLHYSCYWVLFIAFMWILIWSFGVVGALNFYFPPLTILVMVLSLAWTAEVMRNVVNLTVSRVLALYYLRGMQASTQFSFQRAISRSLGSACLGSLFVPAIEALRIVARVLNLVEGEDEFMFSCAHCCLRVMEAIFPYGNSWAFVHISAYGKGFVAASQSTWGLFERHGLEPLVDSDITSSICFLAGISSGSISVIATASWTFALHRDSTATVSLLAFFIGYLLTRISMAIPQACMSSLYVCYAENPSSRAFDDTIPRRLRDIRDDKDSCGDTMRRTAHFAA